MTHSSQNPSKTGVAAATAEPHRAHITRPRTQARRAALASEALALIAAPRGSAMSLDAVAAAIFTSRRQLQRVLMQEAGITFRGAQQRVRIARAHALLASGDVRVGEAAKQVGYRSRSEFTKTFRSVAGELPSQTRRRARAGNRGPVLPPATG